MWDEMAKSVFGAARDTPLCAELPQKARFSGRRWQWLTAQGWVGVSEAAGCLDLCTQNSISPITRVRALNKHKGNSPRMSLLEKPGGENAQE